MIFIGKPDFIQEKFIKDTFVSELESKIDDFFFHVDTIKPFESQVTVEITDDDINLGSNIVTILNSGLKNKDSDIVIE